MAFIYAATSRRRAPGILPVFAVFCGSGAFLTGGWDRIRFHQRRKMVGSCSGAEATALNSRE